MSALGPVLVAAAPSGARIETRLRLNAEDEQVLRAVGQHLGRLAGRVSIRAPDGAAATSTGPKALIQPLPHSTRVAQDVQGPVARQPPAIVHHDRPWAVGRRLHQLRVHAGKRDSTHSYTRSPTLAPSNSNSPQPASAPCRVPAAAPFRSARRAGRRRTAQAFWPSVARSQSTIFWVGAPGVKISATPTFLSAAMSSR